MSFFGTNNSLGASSTPIKPTGLFSTFGSTPTTTATSPFGGAASTTGAASGFGNTQAFGTSGFGITPSATGTATAIPTLGGLTGFGNATPAGAPTSAPTLFGGTAASSGATQIPFGGFGTSNTNNPPVAGFSGFGTAATSAPAFSGFGNLGQANTSFGGGFGASNTTAFGGTFGKPSNMTVTPGFGSFSGNTNFMLGQPQQMPPPISNDEAFAQAILNVSIFGDERDNIIAKWNYLMANWGAGKLFYSQSALPVDVTEQNYLCRFKAMGYTYMPGKDNKLGLVALNFNKTLNEIKPQQQQIVQSLHSIFGSKPNMMVMVDSAKEVDNKRAQLVIYVEEKQQVMLDPKRILATEVASYLSQPNIKMQLNNLGIVDTLALTLPDEDQLKEYYDNPPKGMDPRLWCQAQQDNPDPKKFIPVPMIGFSDLKWRLKHQDQETETHRLYLKKVENELEELRKRHSNVRSRMQEQKRKLAELSHCILQVIVKQECTRKIGLGLTAEEEALRTKLENMLAVLSAPTQFKGRLSELLSQMRMQRKQFTTMGSSEYTLDKESEDEMKLFLTMQQKAMEVLSKMVDKDLKTLGFIAQGLPEIKNS